MSIIKCQVDTTWLDPSIGSEITFIKCVDHKEILAKILTPTYFKSSKNLPLLLWYSYYPLSLLQTGPINQPHPIHHSITMMAMRFYALIQHRFGVTCHRWARCFFVSRGEELPLYVVKNVFFPLTITITIIINFFWQKAEKPKMPVRISSGKSSLFCMIVLWINPTTRTNWTWKNMGNYNRHFNFLSLTPLPDIRYFSFWICLIA